MSWYTEFKHFDILKTASPICPVECPGCGMTSFVDGGEPIDQMKSNQGNPVVGETGVCFFRCEMCKKFSYLAWRETMFNMATPTDLRQVDNMAVIEGTRSQGLHIVRSTPCSKEEYEELSELINADRPIETV